MQRISTNQFNQMTVNNSSQRYVNIAKYQEQIGTGKKSNDLADAPFDTVAGMRLRETQQTNTQHHRNIVAVNDRLVLQESTWGVGESLAGAGIGFTGLNPADNARWTEH